MGTVGGVLGQDRGPEVFVHWVFLRRKESKLELCRYKIRLMDIWSLRNRLLFVMK